MSRVRRLLLALLLVLAALPQAAFAAGNPITPVTIQAQSDSKNAGMGVDGMVKAPDIKGGNQPMLFEKYAPLDYTLNVDLGSAIIGAVTNPTSTPPNVFGNIIANLQMGALLAIGTVTTRSVEWALSLNLITDASGPVDAVVSGLRQYFYDKLQPIALLAVAVVLVWAVALGRVMRAFWAIGWAVLAIVIGGIIMANPSGYMGDVAGFTSWTSQQALAGIGSVDAAGMNRDATTSQGSVQNAELRTFANREWFLQVYEPWTEMQFGQVDPKVPGTNRQIGIALLDKNSGHSSSFDADIKAMPQSVQDWYNGNHGGERAAAGAVALLLVIADMILTLFLVARTVIAAISVVFLVMGVPIILVASLVPGVGQRLLFKWFELVIKNFLTTVIMSIFLGLVMLLTGVFSGLVVGYGWFALAAVHLIILIVAFWNRKTFLALGHHVAHPKAPATTPALPQSQPAMAANRHLYTAQRRMVAPLRGQRAVSGAGANGARALPAAQQAGQVAAKSAGKAVASSGGTAAATGATGGLYLAGLAAVKAGQGAVRGYHALRHQAQAPLAHFVGGMPARPPLPSHGRSPSVLWMGAQQFRASRAANRLPPPQAAPAPRQASPRPQRKRLPSGSQPPIRINKSGARVLPAPKGRRGP